MRDDDEDDEDDEVVDEEIFSASVGNYYNILGCREKLSA